MEYSTRIYQIYMKYVSPDDIHVYSIDEVFIDATLYLKTYGCTARELTMRMIQVVLKSTGITATAGIGTNLYLCKIAMDIVAKHIQADKDGVRIAELDEMSYRRQLWCHRPLTDFWRVGRGYIKKLEQNGMFTMGDIARASLDKYGEDMLYKVFGINAELLIDHAWGWEPCLISDIKAYKPSENSLSSGQVLQCPYNCEKTRLIVKEMTDLLVLDIVEKKLVTDQIVLTIVYDIECLSNPDIRHYYNGAVTTDFYGRQIPKNAHGSINLPCKTSSTRIILDSTMKLFDRIFNPHLLSRKIYVVACHLVDEAEAVSKPVYQQLDIFTDYAALEKKQAEERAELEREKKQQLALIEIKKRFGKNAIVKGMNLEDGATTIERNRQIGGHKA
jgi:DNA polymerase V